MSSLSFDCPYCGSKQSAFLLAASLYSKTVEGVWHTMGECGVCKEVVLFLLNDTFLGKKVGTSDDPVIYSQLREVAPRFAILRSAPKPQPSLIPENIPANVEAPFVEAESAFASGLYSSAAACYRKSIERAVKSLHPDGKGMLNSRIREMEKQKLLPTTLIGLLDQVRILGNYSIHEEDEDPTKEDCEAAKVFANLFLTYIFTLPARIEKAKIRMNFSAT